MTKHMGRLITGAGIATLVAGFAGYTGIEAAVDRCQRERGSQVHDLG